MSYNGRKKAAKGESFAFTAADIKRFFSFIRVEEAPPPGFTDGCWVWLGHCDDKGYGQFRIAGRARWAHRASYRIFKGPIPAELTVEHRCERTGCSNPAHLTLLSRPANSGHHGDEAAPPPEGQDSGDMDAPF